MNERFSIIINNFNYGRFLGDAIRSTLDQTWPDVEVIVVDDGSTDGSRTILSGFGGKIIPVLKTNGGQASAFNAGFAVAGGEYILFLDSDDMLEPGAAREIVARFRQHPGASKVQCRMLLIDGEGVSTGMFEPGGALESGNWRDRVLKLGPSAYPSVPTSASAWPRWFLEKALPMPERGFEVAADAYLKDVSPLYGSTECVQSPLVRYRVHGANTSYAFWGNETGARLKRDAGHFEMCCNAIQRHAERLGLQADAQDLIARRWQHVARMTVLARCEGAGWRPSAPGPLLAAIFRSGTFWKWPLLYLFALSVCWGPKKSALLGVARLFHKNRIGWNLPVPAIESSAHD